MKDVKKNGILLSNDGYELTGAMLEMTRQDLIEEILGTFPYHYLIEWNFVKKIE